MLAASVERVREERPIRLSTGSVLLGNARRIDPADVTVGAPVNDVDAAMGGVAEDDDARLGEVHGHHRAADRQGLQRRCLLGDNGRRIVGRNLALLVIGGKDVALRRERLLAPGEMVFFELALVAP